MTFAEIHQRIDEARQRLAAADVSTDPAADLEAARKALRKLQFQLAEAVRAEAVPPPPGKSWLGVAQAARLLDLLREMPEGSSITITR